MQLDSDRPGFETGWLQNASLQPLYALPLRLDWLGKADGSGDISWDYFWLQAIKNLSSGDLSKQELIFLS